MADSMSHGQPVRVGELLSRMPAAEPMLTVKAAAQEKDVTTSCVRKAISEGRLPGAQRKDSRWFIPASTVRQWMPREREPLIDLTVVGDADSPQPSTPSGPAVHRGQQHTTEREMREVYKPTAANTRPRTTVDPWEAIDALNNPHRVAPQERTPAQSPSDVAGLLAEIESLQASLHNTLITQAQLHERVALATAENARLRALLNTGP